jgi:hypothetical protein
VDADLSPRLVGICIGCYMPLGAVILWTFEVEFWSNRHDIGRWAWDVALGLGIWKRLPGRFSFSPLPLA